MKKIAAVLLVMLMVFGMTACSSEKAQEKAPEEAPAQSNVVTIATSPDFPPFEYLEDGKVVGIEIDILQKVFDQLGMQMEIKEMSFESVLPGVQAGKFTVGASGITVTEKRLKNTLFTDVYCLAAQAIVVKEGSPISSKADLEGKKISVQTGTTAESFCMEQGYDVNAYEANNDAESALVSEKVDAWVIDDLTAKDMVELYNAANPDTKLVILDEAMTTEPYAFALAFGNEELVTKMNEILAQMQKDGTIEGIFKKYDAPFTKPE